MSKSARGTGQLPTANTVANQLHSAAVHLLREVRRTDSATGLSPARLSALSVLVFGGSATICELADAEQVSAATMSRLVSAMETEGLVERHGDASDRRLVRVIATPEGAQLLLQARRNRVDHLSRRVAQLDSDDIHLLARAADLLERVLLEHA